MNSTKVKGQDNNQNKDHKFLGNLFKRPDPDDCYESTSTKEVCKLNEKGDFVCDRVNQVWKICQGQKPVCICFLVAHRKATDFQRKRRRSSHIRHSQD